MIGAAEDARRAAARGAPFFTPIRDEDLLPAASSPPFSTSARLFHSAPPTKKDGRLSAPVLVSRTRIPAFSRSALRVPARVALHAALLEGERADVAARALEL